MSSGLEGIKARSGELCCQSVNSADSNASNDRELRRITEYRPAKNILMMNDLTYASF